MRIEIENDFAAVYPDGNITSLNSHDFENELSAVMSANPGKVLIIDASQVNYISSAGLRVLLKFSGEMDEPLTVRNAGAELYDIFEITGFTELLNVKRKMRRISVDGLEKIGEGAIGKVYRLNDDTIIKVYESKDSLPLIEREHELAKQAFIKGIPTAISFDIVEVGEGYGSVFELLKARILNDMYIEDPGNADEIIRIY